MLVSDTTMSSSHLAPSTRPRFGRSRSHTIPSNSSQAVEGQSTKPTHPPSPGHSNSFLTPVASKPKEAQTLPITAGAGGIVSYAQRHGQNKSQTRPHVHQHKYTQSDVHGSRKHESDALPHLTAGLAAERRRQDQERPKASDFILGPRAHELRRMASARNYRQGDAANTDPRNELKRDELRRRATSDPKPPAGVVKSAIEKALDRAYEKKLAKMASITQKDVDHMKKQSREADAELRTRLDDLAQMATDVTRRLDYTYYSLLERIGTLVSTIHSFQSLSTQSKALAEGFEKEAEHLETDIRDRIGKFRDGFSERETKVADLEQRGNAAAKKAMQLGQRLESARIIVEDWERKEKEASKARARMWKGTWYTLIGLIGVIMILVIWREWSVGGDVVRAGLGTPERGSLNKSLMIDEAMLREKKIPEDVKSILHGIEARQSRCGASWTRPTLVAAQTATDDDKRLRALDEL